MAVSYLKNHHDAEDAVQDTFVKAWRGLATWRGTGSGHMWLMAICRRVCIDRQRRLPKEGPPQSLDEDGHADVRDRRSDHEDWACRIDLDQAMTELSADEFEAWTLMDRLGYTSDEAAFFVGAPASTMRSRLARAREHMAEKLRVPPAPPIGGVLADDVRGLFHSSRANAVVVSLVEMRSRGATAAAPRRGSALDVSFLRMYAHLTSSLARESRASGALACPCLVEFLESLDRHAPAERRLLLLIENASRDIAETTERWLATHPRWRIHTAQGHREWKKAFEELFADQGDARQNHGPRSALTLIDAAQPFTWSDHQNGRHL